MNTVYYLSTCDTCKKILKSLPEGIQMEYREIKTQPLTAEEINKMHLLSGNYESLFNKRAQLYKQLNLKEQKLSESDYKKYLLEHYTFLSRPVFILNNTIYIGNSKKVIEEVLIALKNV